MSAILQEALIVWSCKRLIYAAFAILYLSRCTPGLAADDDLAQLLTDLRSDKIAKVTAALKMIENYGGDSDRLASQLASIVDADEYSTMELTLQALASMKAKAKPAIPALCKCLEDRRHWIRSGAVAALVAIGDEAVEPLRKLLDLKSGSGRAAATEALGRLKQLKLGDLEQLAQDKDPRVRAVVARALATLDKPAIPLLVQLLSDPEVAVCVVATESLRRNHSDPAAAVQGLTPALTRSGAHWPVMQVLASYGTDAQRSIPKIIETSVLDKGAHYYFGAIDGGDALLSIENIGPPHPDDVPSLCKCLTLSDEDLRIAAINTLAMAGLQAKSASGPLTAAARRAADEAVIQKRKVEALQDGDSFDDIHGRPRYVAEIAVGAVGYVTHDARQFAELLKEIVLKTDEPINFNEDSPWSVLGDDVIPLIREMARHPNLKIRETAVAGLGQLSHKTAELKLLAIEQIEQPVDPEIAKRAIESLIRMGPVVPDGTGARLLKCLEEKKLTGEDFGRLVDALEIRTPEVLAKLESGATKTDPEGLETESCIIALCKLTNEPRRIALLCIKAFDDEGFRNPYTIEALRYLKSVEDLKVPFYSERLKKTIEDTRLEVIDALGEMGPHSKPALPEIEKLLQHQNIEIRLKAAKAILLISGDAQPLQAELSRIAADQSDNSGDDIYQALGTIAELKQAGNQFLPYVLDAWSRHQVEQREVIETLGEVGTPQAIEKLRKFAASKDWKARTQALESLEKLSKPGSTNN